MLLVATQAEDPWERESRWEFRLAVARVRTGSLRAGRQAQAPGAVALRLEARRRGFLSRVVWAWLSESASFP